MPLFLLFLIIPLIEIGLFIQVGGAIGLWWTLGIVVLTAILGAFLVRTQGLAVLSQLQTRMNELQDPTETLVHGAMILFSGALLLTPGFFTDAVGFSFMVPAVRSFVFRKLKDRVHINSIRRGHDGAPAQDSDIIDAEYEDLDTPKGPSGWTRH